MRHHPARRATARFGVIIAAAAVAAITAATAASTGARAGSVTGPVQVSAVHRVLLANGDQLMLGAAGAPAAAGVLPGAGSSLAGALVALGSGANGYVIPRVAMPYLGRGLGPALFRLSSLRPAEAGGRLPVTGPTRGGCHRCPACTSPARPADRLRDT